MSLVFGRDSESRQRRGWAPSEKRGLRVPDGAGRPAQSRGGSVLGDRSGGRWALLELVLSEGAETMMRGGPISEPGPVVTGVAAWLPELSPEAGV